MHGFFSSEYLGLRSLRKTIARFTTFHGFFSGKVPSAGVAIAVVGPEEDTGPEPQSGGISAIGRLFSWPWGRREVEEVAVSLPEAETPGTTSRSQFWLGFRWGKREAETDAGGSVVVLDAGEDDGMQDVEVAGSGWSRARGIWGFGRSDSSRPAMVEMEEDVLSDSEEGEELSPAQPLGPDGIVGAQSTQKIDRPWLSIGWTPWGSPARKLDDDLVASEAPTDPAAVEESDVVADAGERAAHASEEGDGAASQGDGAASQEDETLLSRWWPGSSSRDVSRAADATHEEHSEGEQDEKGLDGVGVINEEDEEAADQPRDDGTVGGEAEVYAAKEEQQTLLRRWWPAAKEPISPTVLEQDGVGVSEEGEEEAEEFLNLSLQEEAGTGVDVEQEPPVTPAGPGLISRLWPLIFKAAETSGDEGGDVAPTAQQQPVSLFQEEEEIAPIRGDSEEGGGELAGEEEIGTQELIPLDEEDPSSEEGGSKPGDREEGDDREKEEERGAEDDKEDRGDREDADAEADIGGQGQKEGEGEGQEGSLAKEGSSPQDGPGHAVSDSGEGVGGGSDLSSSNNLSVDTSLAGSDVAGDSEGVVAPASGKPATRPEDAVEECDDVGLDAIEEKNAVHEVESAAAASEGARRENTAAAGPTRQKEPTAGRQWGWQR